MLKSKFSLLHSQKGFSIVGVIVAAGMMGGLALYLANIARQQHVTQRQAETGAELVALYHRIGAVLYDGDACTETLGNGPLTLGPLGELKNKGGTPVVKVNEEINRVLMVKDMELRDTVPPSGAGSQTKEVELWVQIKRLGVANAGKTTERTWKLTVELDSSGNIARCHHTLDSKENAIKTAMCIEMGGEMVDVTAAPGASKECSVSKVFEKRCTDEGGTYEPPPDYTTDIGVCDKNNVFRQFCESLGEGGTVGIYTPGTPVGTIGTCKIDSIYVNLSGDTMTGDLGTKGLRATSGVFSGNIGAKMGMFQEDITGRNITATGNVSGAGMSATGNISAGGTVSAGAQGSGGSPTTVTNPNPPAALSVDCGAGNVLQGVNNGTANCTPLTASCSGGKVMTGITNGVADCVDLPTGGGTTTGGGTGGGGTPMSPSPHLTITGVTRHVCYGSTLTKARIDAGCHTGWADCKQVVGGFRNWLMATNTMGASHPSRCTSEFTCTCR